MGPVWPRLAPSGPARPVSALCPATSTRLADVDTQSWSRSTRKLNEGPIQVRVPTYERIFNPMDPSPVGERSLNDEVAIWIEEWAEDIDGDKPIDLELHIGDGSSVGREEAIIAGLRRHFEYREWAASRRLSELWRDGRISLLIGIAAITAFSTASRLLATSSNPVVEVLDQGLSVVGWVSMWKPIDIFLYGWWPVRREVRAYRRLAEAEVRFPGVTPR